MKHYLIITALIAKILLALGSLYVLSKYLYDRAVYTEQLMFDKQYDQLSAFKELFRSYGCETYNEFRSFVDEQMKVVYRWTYVDGQLVERPVEEYTGAANLAMSQFHELEGNILYQIVNYPDGIIEPGTFALLVMMPIMIFIAYAVVKALYDRGDIRERHERFLSENNTSFDVPYSGMSRYSTGIGTDQQIMSADYNTMADEYIRLKHLCSRDTWEQERFKYIKKRVSAILKKGHKRYPIGNLLRRSGNAFILFGLLLTIPMVVIDLVSMNAELLRVIISAIIYGQWDAVLLYFVFMHQFIMQSWLLYLIPIGLILKMVSRILIQLKDDDMRCRLTQKMVVQEYSYDQVDMMYKMAYDYPVEDLIQCNPREENYVGPR
jgi:hypothetical protein